MPSATRKNTPKKNLTPSQKAAIIKSVRNFNTAHGSLMSTYSKFNMGKPPSEKAAVAALQALARRGGGTRRRRRS
jgi:hypothetical protein